MDYEKLKEAIETISDMCNEIPNDHWRGYSQKALSEKTGINVSTISKYEMGKTVPTIKNVTKIAESLKCTFGWNGNEFWFSQHKSKKKKRKKEIGIYDYWFD